MDGADFNIGVFAGVIGAEACDPDFAVAEHGALIVDEEAVVFLILDDGGDIGRDDVVVVLNERFRSVDLGGFAVELDADGVVDEGGDGGGVARGYGLLEVGDELADLGVGVVADHGVDGFVYAGRVIGWLGGGATLRESVRDQKAGQDEEDFRLGSESHFRLQ